MTHAYFQAFFLITSQQQALFSLNEAIPCSLARLKYSYFCVLFKMFIAFTILGLFNTNFIVYFFLKFFLALESPSACFLSFFFWLPHGLDFCNATY